MVMLRPFGKAVLVFLALVLAGVVLLAASLLLPENVIHDHVYHSVETFDYEGAFPRTITRYPVTIADNNTDAWMLLLADYHARDDTFFEQIFLGKFPVYAYHEEYRSGLTAQDSICGMPGGEIEQIGTYPRYWHGWLFPLRLALCFVNYSGIRMMNIILEMGLFSILLLALSRKNHSELILPFFVTFILLMPVTLPLCMAYMISYCIAMTAMLLLLYCSDGFLERLGFGTFLMAVGAVTAYSEFLQFPLITLGYPLVVLMALRPDCRTFRKAVFYSAVWACGYCGMWAAKWILASLLTSTDVIGNAFRQISLRFSSASNEAATASVSRVDAILRNLEALFRKPIVFLCVAGFAAAVFQVLGKKEVRAAGWKSFLSQMLPFALVAVLPFCWFFALANHSWLHYHFTCRIHSVSIFAVMAGLGALRAAPGPRRLKEGG